MTALRAVTTLDQIPKCEGDVAKDSKYLAIKKDDSSKWVPDLVGLDDKEKVLGMLDESSDTPAASLPDVNGFINDKLLDDWMSICREEIPRKKGRALQVFMVSKTPIAPKGLFESCDKQSSAMRKFMDIPLSPEAAKYLKSKFAQDPGCSSIMEDGTIYYKLLADESQIKIAIASIDKDVKDPKFKFPDGVNKEMAQTLIGQLWAIAKQDPVVIQRKAMEEQQAMMSRNMAIQLAFTGLLQSASTAVFGYFFWQQMKALKDKKDNGSALETYGRNLNQEARDGTLEPVNAELRSAEIQEVRTALMNDRSVVLTGEAGVGKTAVAEAIAFEINAGNIPELANYDIIMLDLNKMVAGTKYRGEFEERLQAVLDAVNARNRGMTLGGGGAGKKSRVRHALDKVTPARWRKTGPVSSGPVRPVILFIDELHRLMGWGGAEGATDASQIIKPALARGELVVIGATTIEEYQRHIAGDRALKQRFKDVFLRGFTPTETYDALRKKLPKIGGAKRSYPAMTVADNALNEIIREAGERFPQDAFPRKADNVLKDIVGWKRLQCADNPARASTLTIEDVRTYFAGLQTRTSTPSAAGASGAAGSTAGRAEGSAPGEAATIRKAQIGQIKQDLIRSLRGYPPDKFQRLAEMLYDKLSNMTQDEREALADPQEDAAFLRETIKELDASEAVPPPEKKPRGGSRKKPGGDPPAPPAAPAGDGGGAAPTAEPAGDGSTAKRSALVVPWTSVTPSPAIVDAASRMPIGAMIPDVGAAVNAALDRIPQFVPAQAVTTNGYVFDVAAMEAPAVQQVATPGVRGSVTLPRGAQVSLGGSTMFAPSAALGVAGGVGGLVASEGLAVLLGRQLKWYEEFGAFVGAGTGISAAHAAASGATITAGGMAASLAHGLPSCLIIFGATGRYLTDAGLEESGRAHKYATVVAGSVLAAATTSAQLAAGATTVAEMGLTAGGLAVGIGASLGVGAALLAGGAVGHGINKGLGNMGLTGRDGDKAFSSWLADGAYKFFHRDEFERDGDMPDNSDRHRSELFIGGGKLN